jgi:hypothetical protein
MSSKTKKNSLVVNWECFCRNRREEGRDRQSYLQCLKRDLCTYYSYNEFMIEKLLHIFPVGEILEVLEANEVQRPVTIRFVPGIFPLP